jgi:glutathione S-transferase
MPLTLYTMSGSPYGWRVWLALEHKRIPYTLKVLSWDAGDFKTPQFIAFGPRRRVPVLDDDGFALYESAAIIEYIADKWPDEPRLFSADLHRRAIERRMVREADQYFAAGLEKLVEAVLFTPPERRVPEKVAAACADIIKELAVWEGMIGGDYLAGPLSAVDFTLYPEVALVERMGLRNADLLPPDWIGPRMRAWMQRMAALPLVQKTWPPHWK